MIFLIERKNQEAIVATLDRDRQLASSMKAWKPDYDFDAALRGRAAEMLDAAPTHVRFDGPAFGDAAQRFIAATQQRPGTHLADREAALACVVLAAYRFCEGRAESPQP